MTEGPDRSQWTVLVPQAETVGALAVVRSLGRAGYRVLTTSPQTAALARHSRFSAGFRQTPSVDAIPAWLDHLIECEDIAAIIPSEGFLLALRSQMTRFEALLPYRSGESAVASLSKWHLFSTTSPKGTGTVVSLSRPFKAASSVLVELGDRLKWPLFLKCDAVHSVTGKPSKVVVIQSANSLQDELRTAEEHFDRAILQAWAPGVGVGACFIRWKGRILARYAHRRLHEVPHRGGASSLRETFKHVGIMMDALGRVERLDHDGPAMFEYRLDPSTGKWALMELNGRFWGSLHLGLYAGYDMPRLLVDAMLGFSPEPEPVGIDCVARLLVPGELQHVLSVMRDPDTGFGTSVRAVVDLILRSIDPRVTSDLFGFRDPVPGLSAVLDYSVSLSRAATSHLRMQSHGAKHRKPPLRTE